MKLEPELTTLDEVPEPFRVNYEEIAQDDVTKKYRLAALKGVKTESEIAALKSALQKEREARRAAEAASKGNDADAVETLRKQLTTIESALDAAAAKDAAVSAITAADGDVETVWALMQSRVRATKKGDKRVIEIVSEDDGAPLLNSDGTPMTVTQFVASLRERKSNLFRGTRHRGAGGPNGDEVPDRLAAAVTRTLHRRKMSPREKVDFVRAYGEEAFHNLPW
jgi:hypothetical protein